jgi:hypothetical protein
MGSTGAEEKASAGLANVEPRVAQRLNENAAIDSATGPSGCSRPAISILRAAES